MVLGVEEALEGVQETREPFPEGWVLTRCREVEVDQDSLHEFLLSVSLE